MENIQKHTATFRQIVERVLDQMFGVATHQSSEIKEANSMETAKTFMVTIHYTGTVFGEYLISMDEETAAKAIGIDEPIDENNRAEIREEICDALSEALNTVVGESIVELQKTYAKLTLTAPRVFFGEVRYPHFRTGYCSLETTAGEIECHFCLDLMRLNLAESYSQAMSSLMDVNTKLRQANTQLAEQQAQLVQSEKMASVGILAAGVAHEINTPLFVVEANLSTLDDYVEIMETTVGIYEQFISSLGSTSKDLPKSSNDEMEDDLDFILEDTRNLLSESRDGANRIKSIVGKLKELAHVDRGGVVETDINLLIENVLLMLGDKLTSIEVERDFDEVPKISGNPGELGQALINILMNSIQASNDQQAQIRIETKCIDEQVEISIQDSGCGIETTVLDRVFDPFFTTRDVGEGTGLGLSISYELIRKHDGFLTIESQVGQGTEAKVRLPISNRAVCLG